MVSQKHAKHETLQRKQRTPSFHLPYTCSWCRVTWAYARCLRWDASRLQGPGTSVGCRMTGCQPGRGLQRSVGNTRPPPPPWTRTSAWGRPGTSSPPPPPAEVERKWGNKCEVCVGGECKSQTHSPTDVPFLISMEVITWATHRADRFCENTLTKLLLHYRLIRYGANLFTSASLCERDKHFTVAPTVTFVSSLEKTFEGLCTTNQSNSGGTKIVNQLWRQHPHVSSTWENSVSDGCVGAPAAPCCLLGWSGCTDQAAALLAAVQPGRSAGVEGASALVQALAAGPVVAARTAEEILVWVPAVAGSSPAVGVAVLHSRGHRGQVEADWGQVSARAPPFRRGSVV